MDNKYKLFGLGIISGMTTALVVRKSFKGMAVLDIFKYHVTTFAKDAVHILKYKEIDD